MSVLLQDLRPAAEVRDPVVPALLLPDPELPDPVSVLLRDLRPAPEVRDPVVPVLLRPDPERPDPERPDPERPDPVPVLLRDLVITERHPADPFPYRRSRGIFKLFPEDS